MTSSVFFKFKSQKEPSRVEFDGTGISVFELKRDIIINSGLGDGTEFDLAIYNEDGSEGMCDIYFSAYESILTPAQNMMMILQSFPDLLR